ncbi:MAG: Trm112 family protein [Planctomycetes bacterium]|nr:Trm112 family protein [Planctomycetota bacterium]
MAAATKQPQPDTPALDPELLSILVCPLSHGPLIQKGNKLICLQSKKAYRIEDGIPIMLVEEATDVPESELLDLKQRETSGPSKDQYPAE